MHCKPLLEDIAILEKRNRLLEKQISLRKKHPKSQEADDDAANSQPGFGSGLLQKKRIGGKRNSKKQHQ